MTDNIFTKIARNTRNYRLKRGLSQVQLAKKARICPSFVSKIENAKVNVYLTTLFSLAKALSVCPADLVK